MNHMFKRILSILSRSSRYLEVELKESISIYRFFFCEGLHEQKQISDKGGTISSHWNSYIFSVTRRTKFNKNIVKRINKCICPFLISP